MILILGKNGAGKTYVTSHLEEMGLKRSISCTTRPKRPMEKDLIDYEFISHDEFEKRIAAGEFVEYTNYRGNYYGTPKKNLETSDLILSGGDISPQIMPYVECIYYIDSPLTIRYNGMLIRKSSDAEMFERLHGENGQYLFDYQAKIFFSDHKQNIVDIIYQSIKDKDLVKAKSFRTFLAQCVETYKQSEHNNESQFLQFLNYEEYILRRMYLEGKLTKEEYDEQICRFLYNNHIPFQLRDEHFDIELDGKPVYCKKLIKTNENRGGNI